MKAHQYFYHEGTNRLQAAGTVTYGPEVDLEQTLRRYQADGALVVLAQEDGTPLGFTSAAGYYRLYTDDDGAFSYYACNEHTSHPDEADVLVSADMTRASVVFDRGEFLVDLGHDVPLVSRIARLAMVESFTYLLGIADATSEAPFVNMHLPVLGTIVRSGDEARLRLHMIGWAVDNAARMPLF